MNAKPKAISLSIQEQISEVETLRKVASPFYAECRYPAGPSRERGERSRLQGENR